MSGTDIEAVKAGRFTATFPSGESAGQFYARLAGDPAAFYVTGLKRNRANGRIVTWQATERAWSDTTYAAEPDRTQGIMGYWLSMSETTGHYGSTFGEPPAGAGRVTAYLNGRPCPAEM